MSVAPSERVRSSLRRWVARTDLYAPDRHLLVAFSGGQDSTCLLHALVRYRKRGGPRITAVHVDHGLRPESAAEAERVVTSARAMGCDAYSLRIDVGRYRAGLKRTPVQQAARVARYYALADAASRLDADAVLAAHTADDQAESLLLHLVRGAGLSGLAGMRVEGVLRPASLGPPPPWVGPGDPAPSVRLVRPLLAVERSTTRAYCEEAGLSVIADASNETRLYRRNQVRLDLLPVLEHLNPSVRSALARTAETMAEDLDALQALVEDLHARLATEPRPGSLRYDLAPWRAQPLGVRRRLLRAGLQHLLGDTRDVPLGAVDDALALVEAGPAASHYHLPRGVRLHRGARDFTLTRLEGAEGSIPG